MYKYPDYLLNTVCIQIYAGKIKVAINICGKTHVYSNMVGKPGLVRVFTGGAAS